MCNECECPNATADAVLTASKLERELLEAHASAPFAYHAATSNIGRCGQDRLMASGALLQITGIGGKELINPVMIRDGLSADTIAAIHRDIVRSYDLATAFKPVALKGPKK